jgi:integrase
VTWTAARLLDDGTGAIAAPLKPLAGALAGSASPAATLEWLGKPHIRELLTGLAAGKLPLTHEALDGWPRPRAVAYLRDLLVDCGVLPAADRQLREFGAWLDRRLEGVAGHPHLRLLDIPRQQPYTGQAITQQRRLDLLRRFATSTDIPIRPRAAACLILLYAQPLSRILRLSTADLTRDRGGQTWLRLGDPPSPVPPPFDALLRQLAATRHDHVPANHASHWLFPGRHAGQPAEYRSMAAQLRDHGLPLRTARISALRQLVLQVPAPVIAGALGFHHTTTRQHVNAGATWSRYAGGGDHQG